MSAVRPKVSIASAAFQATCIGAHKTKNVISSPSIEMDQHVSNLRSNFWFDGRKYIWGHYSHVYLYL